jgi:hypothetical protein
MTHIIYLVQHNTIFASEFLWKGETIFKYLEEIAQTFTRCASRKQQNN